MHRVSSYFLGMATDARVSHALHNGAAGSLGGPDGGHPKRPPPGPCVVTGPFYSSHVSPVGSRPASCAGNKWEGAPGNCMALVTGPASNSGVSAVGSRPASCAGNKWEGAPGERVAVVTGPSCDPQVSPVGNRFHQRAGNNVWIEDEPRGYGRAGDTGESMARASHQRK